MSAKKLGHDHGASMATAAAGIITDGDLRRVMEKHGGSTLSMTADQCMNVKPQVIGHKC